jgi:hypothetical protein
MNRLINLLAVGILSATLALFAQNGTPNPQPGQGRSGAPHAYCDKDGDGLCDYTGKPVGECRESGCPGCNGQCPRGGQGNGQGRARNGGVCPRTGAAPQNPQAR